MTVVKIKKQKAQKRCVIKRKLKLQDYRNCLEAAQIERKINYLRKNKIDVGSLNSDKHLKVKGMLFLLKKLARLPEVQMMIKECDQLIR